MQLTCIPLWSHQVYLNVFRNYQVCSFFGTPLEPTSLFTLWWTSSNRVLCKFISQASLFLTVHLIGILEHSRALRGECTKWLVKKSLLQSSARFLLLTFFHFEPLIFVDSFFGFQISRIHASSPVMKNVFKVIHSGKFLKSHFFSAKNAM